MKFVMMGKKIDKRKTKILVFFLILRIILESDPLLITQRVQLRQDDIPLGEQTVSQVSKQRIQKSSN